MDSRFLSCLLCYSKISKEYILINFISNRSERTVKKTTKLTVVDSRSNCAERMRLPLFA